MAEAIVFTLPQVPDSEQREAHWWLVSDGQITQAGTGTEWVELAAAAGADRKRIALAPAACVRVERLDKPATGSDRQAAAAARAMSVQRSLGDPEALHSASVLAGDSVLTAVVDNGAMLAWLDWARGAGADPHHVVPVGSLMPIGDDWTLARFGSERVIGRSGTVLPFEPSLANMLVGGADPREVDDDEVDALIVAAAESPPLDLRTGKMARRKRIFVDRRRIRELALIAATIPLLALASILVGIVTLDSATTRLNEETLAVAERALGRPVTLQSAESELAQRVGGAGQGGLMAPLTGLYSALQTEEGVSSTAIAYRSDGTITTTLAAPTLDPINRVLIAMQRSGYRITAVPRQAPDGRAMVDVTVRSGP